MKAVALTAEEQRRRAARAARFAAPAPCEAARLTSPLAARLSQPEQPPRQQQQRNKSRREDGDEARQGKKRSRTGSEQEQQDFTPPHSTSFLEGTCQLLEKPYLRLGSMPRACDVRPPEVLKQSLALIRRRWGEHHDYGYAREQLKSVRQDLTVQHCEERPEFLAL
jgi:hypothetical protein